MTYRKSLASHIDTLSQAGLSGGIEWYPHQVQALQSISRFLSTQATNVANILQACGTGKTYEEIAILQASETAKKEHTISAPNLIVYTENAIKSGIMSTLESQNMDFAVWENGRKPTDRGTIVASIQTLQLQRNAVHTILSPDTPLILGDEADLYLTLQRMGFLAYFPDAIRLGFSATGEWEDKRKINDIWGETLYHYTLTQAIQDDVVVRPRYQLVESSVSMTAYPRTQGQYAEYTTEQLEQVLVEAEIYRGIVDVYTALVGADKKAYPTLVFVPSVHMVNLTVKAFLDTYKKDIRVKWWTGDATDEGSISDDIQAYLRGEIDVLVACDMGGRGMNLPNARLLIDAYPTRSMTKIGQRHPRVMRKNRSSTHPKEDCIIVQIVPTTGTSRPRFFTDLFDTPTPRVPSTNPHNIDNLKRDTYKKEPYTSLTEKQSAALHRMLQINPGTYKYKVIQDISTYTTQHDIPMLSADGSIEIDGVVWGSIRYFKNLLGCSEVTIKKNIRNQSGKFAQIEDVLGRHQMSTIYPISYLRQYIQDTGGIVHTTPDFQTPISIGNDTYYVKSELRRLTNQSQSVVDIYCKKGNVPHVQGKCLAINRRAIFFSLEEFQKVILKERGDIRSEDETTTHILRDGKTYRSLTYLVATYGISGFIIKQKIKDTIKGIGGKDAHGRTISVYNESDVKKLAEYIRTLPKINAEGFFEKDGKTYVGGDYMERIYKKAASLMSSLCKRHKIPSCEAINTKGRESVYYELDAVIALMEKQKK